MRYALRLKNKWCIWVFFGLGQALSAQVPSAQVPSAQAPAPIASGVVKLLRVSYLSGPVSVNGKPAHLHDNLVLAKPLTIKSAQMVPVKLGFKDGYIFLFPETEVTIKSKQNTLELAIKSGQLLVKFKRRIHKHYKVLLVSEHHRFEVNTATISPQRLGMFTMQTLPENDEDRLFLFHVNAHLLKGAKRQLIEKNQKYAVVDGKAKTLDFVEFNIVDVREDDFDIYRAQSSLLYSWNDLSWLRRKLLLYHLDNAYIVDNAMRSYNEGDLDMAVKLMSIAVEKDSEELKMHYLLAVSYFEKKDYEHAIPHIEMALNFPEADKELLHYYLGVCYYRTQQTFSAQSAMENAILNVKRPELRKSSAAFLVDILRNRMFFYSAFLTTKYSGNPNGEPNIEPQRDTGSLLFQSGGAVSIRKRGGTDLSYIWSVDNSVSVTRYGKAQYRDFDALNVGVAPALRLPLDSVLKSKNLALTGRLPLSFSRSGKGETSVSLAMSNEAAYDFSKKRRLTGTYSLGFSKGAKDEDNNFNHTLSARFRLFLAPWKNIQHLLRMTASMTFLSFDDGLKNSATFSMAIPGYEGIYKNFTVKSNLLLSMALFPNEGSDGRSEATSGLTFDISYQPISHYLISLSSQLSRTRSSTDGGDKTNNFIALSGSWYF